MKNLKRLGLLILIATLSLGILIGCSSDVEQDETKVEQDNDSEEKGKVKIAYINWADNVAMTELAKQILEDKMGYEVETINAEAGVVFTSLADGSADFFMDLWLPITHKDYYDKYEDDLVKMSKTYDAARIGLVVPEYVDINSVEELEAKKEMFDGKIVGIDSGAGVMISTEEALEEYDIDMDLITGSEPTMVASLQDAIDNEEPIVVTAWDPHWKFAKWDLKFLEDPKNIYGDGEEAFTVARKGTKEDMPEVHQFFENFHMEVSDLEKLMDIIEEGSDMEADVRDWIEDNEELVEPWIPVEQ